MRYLLPINGNHNWSQGRPEFRVRQKILTLDQPSELCEKQKASEPGIGDPNEPQESFHSDASARIELGFMFIFFLPRTWFLPY